MFTIRKINHVAVVVDDMERSLAFWRDTLGMTLSELREVPEEQSRVAFLPAGESDLELVEPTSETTGVARFRAKRGPGIHHLCLEVDGLGDLLEKLKNQGIRLIDEFPRVGEAGRRYAFIHPESAGGVLVELYETDDDLR